MNKRKVIEAFYIRRDKRLDSKGLSPTFKLFSVEGEPFVAQWKSNLTNDFATDRIDVETRWITVNGARIPIDGELPTCEAGIAIFREAVDYSKLNSDVEELIASKTVKEKFGTVVKSEPVEISSVNNHGLKHGITKEQAQEFVNKSLVMFDQGNRNLYFSSEGNAVVLDNNRRLIMAYGKNEFDKGADAILGVLKNEWNLQMSDD